MDTGWINPNSAYLGATFGGTAWENPRNALTDDGQYSSVFIPKNGETFHFYSINYRLTVDEIPDGSTIDGIIARILRYASTGGAVEDLTVKLWREGEEIGDNKASAEFWPTSEEAKDYGAEDDLWGTSDLTDAQVRDCDFGIKIACANNTGDVHAAHLEVIQLKIYYTPGAGAAEVEAIDLSKHIHVP